MILPSTYTPQRPAEFIGGAARIARILDAKAARLARTRDPFKLLLFGPPGVGKTRLAEMLALRLAGHHTAVESINGRNVTLEVVRRWQEQARYTNLFGTYTVRIVNELDTCPPAAQDLLLTYLDEIGPGLGFIGTSNLELNNLVARFQTRLQQFKVNTPNTSELADFIRTRWKLAKSICDQIAVGSGGNVRAALLDTESILDTQRA